MIAQLQTTFQNKFGFAAQAIYKAPGRINIIGEHTDYNNGFVLPAAIKQGVYIAISKRNDNTIHLFASNFNKEFIGDCNLLQKTQNLWANYVIGVLNGIKNLGFLFTGFDAIIYSDVPVGAGLSSSAALSCVFGFAISDLFNLQISKIEIAKIAQKAEHEFAGVKCGIMDQFASLMGKKNHCIKLDCKILNYEYVPLQLDNYEIVLLNTNVKHNLASSAYNQRRQECEQAVAWVQQTYPQVQSLRDVSIAMLDENVLQKDAIVYKRSAFIVNEIQRLQDACVDLQQNNIVALGQKMFATHYGLQNDYAVSCVELDFLIEAVKNNPAIIGARMMGGGFGGCTINIVQKNDVQNFIENISITYEKAKHLPLTAYVVATDDGARRMWSLVKDT